MPPTDKPIHLLHPTEVLVGADVDLIVVRVESRRYARRCPTPRSR